MPHNPKQKPVVDADAIIDRVERTVRWADEFRLGFVRCNLPTQREEMRRKLLDRLKDKRVLEVFLEKPIISLLDELTVRWDTASPPHAVCVYGLEKSIQEQREASRVLGRLNNDRDLIRRAVPAALLIWLPDFALDCVVRGAPDFWAWRSGVYEFPTDLTLWQTEAVGAPSPDASAEFSLSSDDKRKEIVRLEDLLRTARTLPRKDKRQQSILCSLLYRLGLLYFGLGELTKAQEQFEDCLQIAQWLEDQPRVSNALNELGLLAQIREEYGRAKTLHEESLAISRRSGDWQAVANTLNNLGALAQQQSLNDEARERYEESLTIKRQLGDQHGIAYTLHNLGRLEQQMGDLDAARAFYEESLALKQRLNDRGSLASTLHQLGTLAHLKGDHTTARAHYDESLKLEQQLGDQLGIAETLVTLGILEQTDGDAAKGAYLWRQALELFERAGAPQAQEVRKLLQQAESQDQADHLVAVGSSV